MIDFDRPFKDDIKPYENIRKTAIGLGDNYTAGCLLDYLYLEENYKMVAIGKQQALDVSPKEYNKLILLKI